MLLNRLVYALILLCPVRLSSVDTPPCECLSGTVSLGDIAKGNGLRFCEGATISWTEDLP